MVHLNVPAVINEPIYLVLFGDGVEDVHTTVITTLTRRGAHASILFYGPSHTVADLVGEPQTKLDQLLLSALATADRLADPPERGAGAGGGGGE